MFVLVVSFVGVGEEEKEGKGQGRGDWSYVESISSSKGEENCEQQKEHGKEQANPES